MGTRKRELPLQRERRLYTEMLRLTSRLMAVIGQLRRSRRTAGRRNDAGASFFDDEELS